MWLVAYAVSEVSGVALVCKVSVTGAGTPAPVYGETLAPMLSCGGAALAEAAANTKLPVSVTTRIMKRRRASHEQRPDSGLGNGMR
jgi:hypothetical protein